MELFFSNAETLNAESLENIRIAATKANLSSCYSVEEIDFLLNEKITAETITSLQSRGVYFLYAKDHQDKDEILGYGLRRRNLIVEIYVHPRHQKKGVGKAIYGEMEKRILAEKHPHVILNASLNAVNFYKNLGFEFIEELQLPKLNNIRVVRMTKPLDIAI